MTSNILLEAPITEETAEPSLTSLQEVAETIQIDALQHAYAMSIHPARAVDLAELLRWHDFVNHFKFGVAERIANTLAAHDEHVQAIYTFDPNLSADAETETYAPLDPSVNLLVQVTSKTAALQSFIAAIDKALTKQANTLPSPLFSSLETMLNAIVITGEDVRQKQGYAALLSSLYLKPRRIL